MPVGVTFADAIAWAHVCSHDVAPDAEAFYMVGIGQGECMLDWK